MSQAPDSPDNYCYRHPNRQSYILCQRCGRTICPECQTQGAVGVICPECMKQQRATAPRTKPRFVAQAKSGQHPLATYGIIAVTLFVYILQWIPGLNVTATLQYAGVYSMPDGPQFEPWRMLTVAFVHSTGFILHVALNMYMLWLFGRILEPMLGMGRFIALYFISAFGGSLGVYLLDSPLQPVVGASGAIFGLVGAFFVILHHLGRSSTQLLILIGINLVIGFLPGLHISWQAHVGGLVIGGIVGLIYVFTRPIKRRIWQIPLLAVLCLAMIGALFVR